MKKVILILVTVFLQLNANMEDLSSFEAKFKQIITNKNAKKLVYSGVFYAKKNNLALWKYETPITKVIYYYRNSITVIEYDLEQAIVSSVNEQNDLLQIIKSAKKISNNSYLAKCCETDYYIYVDDKNSIKKVQYSDKLGNTNSIIFEDQKLNHEIKDFIFRPKVPENFDIITQ